MCWDDQTLTWWFKRQAEEKSNHVKLKKLPPVTNESDSLEAKKNALKNLYYDPKKIVPLTTPETQSPSARAHNHHSKNSPDSKRAPRQNGDYGYGDNSVGPSVTPFKPHTGGDVRWEAINSVTSRGPQIGLDSFRLLKRLGYGDIGSVYLADLQGTNAVFAMKVMDKASLISRNKLLRAQTEREILSLLDHPFLPTLYSYFETEKFYCLVMEFCSGGNLHSLRQKQPNRRFTEEAARWDKTYHLFGVVLCMLSETRYWTETKQKKNETRPKFTNTHERFLFL